MNICARVKNLCAGSYHSRALVNSALLGARAQQSTCLDKALQESGGLIRAQLAEIPHVLATNLAMLVDVGQDHLLLLQGIKPDLADVVGGLAQGSVDRGAQGVGASLLDAVGLDQASLDQPLHRGAGGGRVPLNQTRDLGAVQPPGGLEPGEDEQVIERHERPNTLLLFEHKLEGLMRRIV